MAIPLMVIIGWIIGQVSTFLSAATRNLNSSSNATPAPTISHPTTGSPCTLHAPQPMSLDYEVFSVTALLLSVIHANLVLSDGTSTWFMGVQLCAVYALIALVYFYS
jgi:Ca2+/H+ antiporter